MEDEMIADIAAELRDLAWKWTKDSELSKSGFGKIKIFDPELSEILNLYADMIENAAELVYENGRHDGYDRGYSDGYYDGRRDAENDVNAARYWLIFFADV